MNNEWISVDNEEVLPPDDMVLVKDRFNNEAHGNPTYYPFKIVKMEGDERKQWGWRGTPVPCDNYWDGGWMVLCDGLDSEIKGEITHWKHIQVL